jgi:hypothetical protein
MIIAASALAMTATVAITTQMIASGTPAKPASSNQ